MRKGYSPKHRPSLRVLVLVAQRWHELGPPPLGARDSRVVANAGAVEEALMAIVAGFDVHRAQITFDALDTDSGEVMRGRIDATPAAVRRWVRRFAAGRCMSRWRRARAGCSSVTRSWPRCGGASGRAGGDARVAGSQAARQDRSRGRALAA